MNDHAIWKYPITILEEQTVEMPIGARILSVQMQGGGLVLWALVDPEANREKRRIAVHGTGHPVDIAETRHFIGTVQTNGGALVWHVFDGGTRAPLIESRSPVLPRSRDDYC